MTMALDTQNEKVIEFFIKLHNDLLLKSESLESSKYNLSQDSLKYIANDYLESHENNLS